MANSRFLAIGPWPLAIAPKARASHASPCSQRAPQPVQRRSPPRRTSNVEGRWRDLIRIGLSMCDVLVLALSVSFVSLWFNQQQVAPQRHEERRDLFLMVSAISTVRFPSWVLQKETKVTKSGKTTSSLSSLPSVKKCPFGARPEEDSGLPAPSAPLTIADSQ